MKLPRWLILPKRRNSLSDIVSPTQLSLIRTNVTGFVVGALSTSVRALVHNQSEQAALLAEINKVVGPAVDNGLKRVIR